MTLIEGIEQYIERRRSIGGTFSRVQASLLAFARSVGNLDLKNIDTSLVIAYLDQLRIGTATWRQKYYIFLRFHEFRFLRGEIPELSFPPPRLPVKQVFVPYIFNRSELRSLFKATREVQSRSSRIPPQSMHAFLLFL
jgi:hypothetical protein